MNLYLLSIILVIVSNVFYHICQKSTPENVSPFAALSVTYAVALVVSLIALAATSPKEGIIESIKQVNWVSVGLGFGILGLETGFLLAYRAGWNMSLVALVSTILVSLILIPIGLIFFKEHLTLKNIVGVILSLIGIIFLYNK